MKEQVFFKINDDELFLDKVLVEYNEAPIFFVCKNNENYFVASCVDLKKEEYIVVEVSLYFLSKMLHGKMTMRDLILRADMFWDITVGEDVEGDIVIPKNMEAIPLDALPYEDACLKIVTKELEKYVEKVDAVLYGEGIWEDSPVQECVKCIDNLLKELNEQYENIFQGICKGIVEIANRNIGSLCDEIENVNELYSSQIQIKVKNTEMNRVLVCDGKYPFAA